MSVAVFIEHRVQPGRRDEVRAVWEKWMRPAILANDAHEAYAYTFDSSDPDVIRAFQQYRDAAAAASFLETAAYRSYLLEVEPLLLGPPVVRSGEVQWSKPT